jgi:hypothetical protein
MVFEGHNGVWVVFYIKSNLHKKVRDNCSFINLHVYMANIPLAKFSWHCYVTLYNANSSKIPLNYVIFVSLV